MTTTHDHYSRVRMDPFDRDIFKDMLLWDPHGVLYDEDLYPEFGMNVQQFRQRLVHLLAAYAPGGLDPADRALVEGARRYRRYCQMKPFVRTAYRVPLASDHNPSHPPSPPLIGRVHHRMQPTNLRP